MLKGVKCAPSHNQTAARIGSEVVPYVLPAVAQANKVIKANGKSTIKIDLITCCSDTQNLRATIIFLSAIYPFNILRIKLAVSLGVLPTATPTASNASFLAAAVPEDPETIAPACPMVFPSGAVNPAT